MSYALNFQIVSQPRHVHFYYHRFSDWPTVHLNETLLAKLAPGIMIECGIKMSQKFDCR